MLRWSKWGLVLLACLSCFQAMAQTSLLINSDKRSYKLNEHIRIQEEYTNEWSLDAAITQKNAFKRPNTANPNYGFGKKGIWFYVPFRNNTATQDWVLDIEFAQNDRVDIYLLANGELIHSSTQGKYFIDQVYRYPVADLALHNNKRLELFIRVHTPSQNRVVPITLQTKDTFSKSMSLDNVLWGLFYGGLLMLLIYSLATYAESKEFSLLAYGVYLCTVVFFQFVWGGHIQLLFNNAVVDWISDHTDLLFVLTGLGSGFFTLTFLDAAHSAPKTTKFIKIVLGILGVLGLLSIINVLPSDLQNYLVYVVSMAAIASYMYAGFESYLNHFKPARYFVIAWSLLSISALIGMFGLVGILPSNFFTTYCFQIGVFFESALFSIALIEKSRHQLEQDVRDATNDLIHNMELIEEQNVRLDIARKEAIKASHIKSQFLANMSHEIRTPLNAILGFSKELSKLVLPVEKQEHVQIINTSASNLLAIVNDVLDFSKIEAGKLRLNKEEFSPTDLFEELVFVHAREAHRKHLTFIYEAGSLPEKMLGDPARIKQVLTNLLGNALKFTQKGYIELTVKGVELENDLFELQFLVEDTGIGIEEHSKHKLFRAFSQLDTKLTRSYQGTGLGLVICQQLVQLMGGEISFQSTYGQGSSFNVNVLCHRLSRNSTLTNHPYWENRTVIIYDRQPFSRKAKAALFKGLGATVTSVDSLNYLDSLEESFDFLFVDINTLNERNQKQVLECCVAFDASEKVLLHNDPESISSSPELRTIFQRILENPLLLSRVLRFFDEEEETQSDIWTQRLSELPPVRVLAVNDMEINLRLLKTWLRDSPLNLVLCYSGKEAVDYCKQQEFDLILMDVQMPGMDGVEATKLIRKTQLNQGTPIIAVTAHAFREEQERLMMSGMDDYLPKPLDLDALINQIKRWCAVIESPVTDKLDFDWELAIRRANGNKESANEMFNMFMAQLPGVLKEIEEAKFASDWEQTIHHVHRLNGASCYTGVPKLQHYCEEAEWFFHEQNHDASAASINMLMQAAKALIDVHNGSGFVRN